MQVRSRCRRLKAKHKLGLMAIDYLQLVRSGMKRESREIEVGVFNPTRTNSSSALSIALSCAP